MWVELSKMLIDLLYSVYKAYHRNTQNEVLRSLQCQTG